MSNFLEQVDQVLAEAEQEAPVYLRWPNGDPVLTESNEPAAVFVVGKESRRYRSADDAENRKLAKLGRKPEPADWRRAQVGKTAAAITRWTLPAEFNPDNVKHLLRVDEFLEQINAGIMGHSDFLRNGSAS